jgi:type IV secretion system protein VirB10
MALTPGNPSPRSLPPGNDPRLKLDPDDLKAASERALPDVAKAKGGVDYAVVAAGLAALALGGVVFFGFGRPQPPAPVQPPPPPVSQPQVSTLPPIDPSANAPVEAPPIVQPMPPTPAAVAVPPVDANAARAPALVIDNSAPQAPAPAAPASGAAPAAASVTLNANDQFAAKVNGDITQKASKIGDPSKVVPAGAVIPAVLETAINSDLPGYTRAIVSRDIRSFDGTAILIPRGSRLIGQYKSGLASGETRAFIIWNRLIRPDGLSIQLASPATDDLGQAGASGSVDTHFVKRFGAAMLLSVVNGLAGSLSKNTSNTIVIGTSTDAQNVATEALSNDVKIPPTIKVPQGAPIQVFAARDLDFAL